MEKQPIKYKLGIDLGTSSIVVVLKDKGIVRNEPDIIAIEKKTNKNGICLFSR